MSTFFLGVWAYFANWKPSREVAIGSMVLAAAILILSSLHPDYRYVFIGGPHVKAYFHEMNETASLLVGLLVTPFAIYTVHQKSDALDRHCGNIAYPIYLFHMTPVLVYRSFSSGHDTPARMMMLGAAWAVVAFGSLAIYWLFERPIDRRRAAFVSSRLTREQVAAP